MEVIFATKCRKNALEYLQKAFPTHIVNEETAKPILDLVEQNHIRIGDPMMYGANIPVYPSTNYQPADKDTISEWMMNLKEKP